MTPLGFLDLPAELRLQIYETAITSRTEPVKEHLDWYIGFIISCKTVYSEVEHEVVKNTNKHLTKIKETWNKDTPSAPLRVSFPSTIAEVQSNISVSIPHSWIRNRCVVAEIAENERDFDAMGDIYRIPRSFTMLFPLHLSRIIITTHEDQSAPFVHFDDRYGVDMFQGLLDMLDHTAELVLIDDSAWSVCDDRFLSDALTLVSDLPATTSELAVAISLGQGEGPPDRLIAGLHEVNPLSYRRPDGTTYQRNYSYMGDDDHHYELEDVRDTNGMLIGMTYHRLAEEPPFRLANGRPVDGRLEPRYAEDLRVIAKPQRE